MLYAVDDELANVLRRGPAPLAVSSEDADFPAAGLVDRKPWEVFRFGLGVGEESGEVLPDATISKDVELVTNPGFETWADDLPAGWSLTAGSSLDYVFEETSIIHAGAKSVVLGQPDIA